MSQSKKTFLSFSVFFISFLAFIAIWYALFIAKISEIWSFDIFINIQAGILHQSDLINRIIIFITECFDPSIFLSWFLLLLGILMWRNMRYEALFLFFGVAGGQTIKIIVKLLTDRSRPENPFILSAHESGFPSGHATTSVFFCMAILYLFTKNLKKTQKFLTQTLFLSLIFLVPFSRVFVQVHYFSDVVAGIFLGIASFSFTVLFFDFLKEKGFVSY